jgi:hypothetical protein
MQRASALVSDSLGKLAIWRDSRAEPVAMAIHDSGSLLKTYIRLDLLFHKA